MAYKKKSSSKSSSKNSYFDSILMNELHDSLVNIYLKTSLGIMSVNDMPVVFNAAWAALKDRALSKTTEGLVGKLEEAIGAVSSSNADAYFEEFSGLLNEHRRQSDISSSEAKFSIMKFWVNCIDGSTKKFDIPWLRRISVSEKFMPYHENGDRYIFKGFANQVIIANAIERFKKENPGIPADPVVVFMGDVQKIVGSFIDLNSDTNDTAESQIKEATSKIMKGKKSLSSVFVRTSRKSWVNSDGTFWKGEKGVKSPSREEIDSGSVESKEIVSYLSQPVWCISALLGDLPPSISTSFEKLKKERVVAADFDKISDAMKASQEVDLNNVIDSLIDSKIERMSLTFNTEGDAAYYNVVEDSVTVPNKNDFMNPVMRYANTMHELAHSTIHLCGRYTPGKFGSLPYAMEEVVAETCAVLMVNSLLEDIKNSPLSEKLNDWMGYFDDYYVNAAAYNKSWGNKFDFAKCIGDVISGNESVGKNNKLLESVMSNTVFSYQVLSTCLVNGESITKNLRSECLAASFSSRHDASPV